MSTAEPRWHILMQALGADRAKAEKHWQVLEICYRSEGRHYHTMRHIEHFLGALGQFDPTGDPALRFAAFYHDAVYDTTENNNESQSARLAMGVLTDLGAENIKQEVAAMILSTAGHWAYSGMGIELAKLELFLDCDLLILAANPPNYDSYARAIRQEYVQYADDMYRAGRRTFLQTMLQREQISKTPAIRDLHERQARRNLQRELSLML